MFERDQPLLTWQLSGYPTYHAARSTLLVHILTVPLFHGGLLLLLSSPWTGRPAAGAAVVALVVPVVVQGSAHRREVVPPAPFLGPGDVIARIIAEQLVTFPRFVWSGGFLRAWRAASA